MAATPHLLSLPNELLEHVAEHVADDAAEESDYQDLKALRLTCRALHAAADREFVASFFMRRCHLVTQYSLGTLVSITASPRLRGQLKSLMLSTASLPYADNQNHTYRRYEITMDDKNAIQSTYDKKSRELDTKLFQNGVALELLVTALTHLKTAGISLKLGSEYGRFDEGFGRIQIAKMIGFDMLPNDFRKRKVRYGNSAANTRLLLEAIVATSFPLKFLELSGVSSGRGLVSFMMDPSKASSLYQIFNSLMSLELDCKYAFRKREKAHDIFLKLLESANSLRELSLRRLDSFGLGTSTTFFDSVVTIFSRHKMKSIQLFDSEATARGMQRLLEPHKNTLASLVLADIDFSMGEGDMYTWNCLFTTLAQDFTLREFYVRDLWDSDRTTKGVVRAEGKEEVRKSLETLAGRDDLFVVDV